MIIFNYRYRLRRMRSTKLLKNSNINTKISKESIANEIIGINIYKTKNGNKIKPK